MPSFADEAASRRRFLQCLAGSPLWAAGAVEAFAGEAFMPGTKLPDPLMWAPMRADELINTREQVERATAVVEELRTRQHGRIVVDAVVPDYYARYPKPCVGGWGRRSLNVTPAGKVLPCHAAESIAGLTFWNVRDHSLADI
jgi:MoaA/NifB/PqqE/SkfB family radical SAM enzyme